jgi:hypothetical protein
MNHFSLISLATVYVITTSPALADLPNSSSSIEGNKARPEYGESDPEHVPPASPSLIDSVLDEIPAESTDSFLRRATAVSPRSVNVSLEELRRFSITLDRQGKEIQGVPGPDIISTDFEGPPKIYKYYPLTRPGEANFVAIALTITDGAAILNPIQGFNYGPIPFLPKLTLAQADSLWGHAGHEEAPTPRIANRNYKLTAKNQHGEIKEFSITCIFRNDILYRYTISFEGVHDARFGPMYYR